MSTIKATNIQPQSDSDPLVLSTNAAERMRINTAGNVGIGTTSPTGLLTVFQNTREATAGGLTGSLAKAGIVLESALNGSGDPQYGPGLFWKSSTASNTIPMAGIFVGGRGQGSCINLATSTTYANGINKIGMTVTDGKVGIGTTGPGYALDVVTGGAVQAQIAFSSSTLGGLVQLGHDLNGDAYIYEVQNKSMRLGTNNTESIRITPAGLVGIGVINPTATLSVNGGVSVSGGLTANSFVSVGSAKLSAPSGSAPMYVCRAFANYTLTGTETTGVLVAEKTNNLTFTRSATGVYVGTFDTAMPDADYVVVVSAGGLIGAPTASRDVKIHTNASTTVTPTTSSFTFTTMRDGTGSRDVQNFSVAVFA